MYSKLPDNNNTFLSSFFEAQLCNMCSLYIEIQFPQKSCKIVSFSINRNKITMVYSSVIYSSARQLLTGKSHTKYQVCLSISKACDATENAMIASFFFFPENIKISSVSGDYFSQTAYLNILLNLHCYIFFLYSERIQSTICQTSSESCFVQIIYIK